MAAKFDWETIRAEYEVGATMGELSRKHGVSKAAISKKAKKEGWTQDLTGAVNRLAEAKVNGLVDTVDPQKKAEAMAAAADQKAAVIREHREAWAGVNKELVEARGARDFETLKCLKISIEAMKIAQEGQRKAWGIADVVVEQHQDKQDAFNLAMFTPEQLKALRGLADEKDGSK